MGDTSARTWFAPDRFLLLAALASTLVAAEIADWKRGVDAIVAKLQTNDDASALAKDVDTLVPENRNPLEVAKLAAQATDSSDDEGWRSTRLNDGGLLQEEDLNESRMMKGLSKGNNLVEPEVEYGQTRMRKGGSR